MADLRRRIVILGSTGSIGTSALDVVDRHADRLEVIGLSTHSRVDDLIAQAERYRPAVVAVTGAEPTESQRAALARLGVKLMLGDDALVGLARLESADVVLLAVVGAAGVRAAVATVEAGRTLALANKESLVVAGAIVMSIARKTGAAVLPVDSEHSAIHQCIRSGQRSEVSRIILTASGGALRDVPLEQALRATPAEALRHPVWSMGQKVTIDSATCVNKALEIIEAAHLFELTREQIEVVIHPQSIVHSMVEFADGSTIAQLSPPDMRLPIQYALTSPDRCEAVAPRMDFAKAVRLDFHPPDMRRYPALGLGFEVVERGGSLGCVFNAASEVATEAFLDGTILLGEIHPIIRSAMQKHALVQHPTLTQLLEIDEATRRTTREIVGQRAYCATSETAARTST